MEQPPAPIETTLPAPHFRDVETGPFALAGLHRRARPLGGSAPRWARRLYWNSLHVLIALTDPRTGAMIAGERDGWDYVWPRDAAVGAMALQAAGLHAEARRVVGFLANLDTDAAARFHPDGSTVPGRAAAGDGDGWIEAAARHTTPSTFLIGGRIGTTAKQGPAGGRDREDYGENVSAELLGNAIAGGAAANEIEK